MFDFLHIDDLIEAIELVVGSSTPPVLNIGTGQGVSTYDAAQSMVAIAESPSTVELIDIDDSVSNVVVDPIEAKKHLGWEARIDLATGLKRIFCHDDFKKD